MQFVVGDGIGPLVMYEWVKGTWMPHVLVERIDNGHSLSLVDLNADGHLDIFCAEMRLDGGTLSRRFTFFSAMAKAVSVNTC